MSRITNALRSTWTLFHESPSRWPRRRTGRGASAPWSRFLCRLEMLEERTVLTAGLLDPTFGAGGLVVVPDIDGPLNDMVLQTDGKTVMVGRSGTGASSSNRFLVVRTNVDGSLDDQFGTGGVVTTDFGNTPQFAAAVAIQGDGKIVAVGSSGTGFGAATDFALARYNPDGSLDEGFGTGGLVTTDLGGGPGELAQGVVIQPDGKIIAVGSSSFTPFVTDNFGFALARYNPDGSLDESFGSGGKTSAFFGSDRDSAQSVALQPDGSIVVVGSSEQELSFSLDFAVARFHADGTLDDSFGDGGKATTDFFGFLGDDRASGVAVNEDGTIVVTGSATATGSSSAALVRYTAEGILDTTFGTEGKATTASASALGMAVQADDKILLAGSSGGEFSLIRYTPDGAPDESFGDGGSVTTAFADGSAGAFAVAVDAGGRIVVAGRVQDADGLSRFAAARYFGESTPLVESVDVGRDLQSFVVELNDVPLDPAQAQNPANYRVLAANGDASGDGDPFNDGDEVELVVEAVEYDAAANRVTARLADAVFADSFRVELDGDDATSDGTPGIRGVSGEFLMGGTDFAEVVDLRVLTLFEELLTKVESGLGLSNGTQRSLTARLEAATIILGAGVQNDSGLVQLLEAFKIGVDRAYDRGELTQEDRDDLIGDADLILLGLSLQHLSEPLTDAAA